METFGYCILVRYNICNAFLKTGECEATCSLHTWTGIWYVLISYAPTYQVKFLVCANLLGNKIDSDSDSDRCYRRNSCIFFSGHVCLFLQIFKPAVHLHFSQTAGCRLALGAWDGKYIVVLMHTNVNSKETTSLPTWVKCVCVVGIDFGL